VKYNIKHINVGEPVVELPEGSKVVSVEYRGGSEHKDGIIVPECWLVTYLEPAEDKEPK